MRRLQTKGVDKTEISAPVVVRGELSQEEMEREERKRVDALAEGTRGEEAGESGEGPRVEFKLPPL